MTCETCGGTSRVRCHGRLARSAVGGEALLLIHPDRWAELEAMGVKRAAAPSLGFKAVRVVADPAVPLDMPCPDCGQAASSSESSSP